MFSGFFKKKRYIFILLFLLVIVIYGQSTAGGFVKDDRFFLNNISWLTGGDVGYIIMHAYWNTGLALYRPVTMANFALDLSVFGQSPGWMHLENILLYLLACWFIYLLAERMFKRKGPALITALFFLVLPIHTEAVANITGRGDILALLFSVLAMLECAREKKPRFLLIGLWTFLAIASKEVAVAVFPLVFLILFFKEKSLGRKFWKENFRPIYAVVLAGAFYFFLRFFSLYPGNYIGNVKTELVENPLLSTDVFSRIATALKVLSMYLSKTFIPINLCSDYSYNQIPVLHTLESPGAMFGLAFCALMVFLFFFYIRKRPVVSLGAGIFLFSFLPVSNFLFPIGTIAGERLFLFPSLGISFIVAFLVWKIYEFVFKRAKDGSRTGRFGFWILITASAGILTIYMVLTFVRQADWMSEKTLFLNDVKCAPRSVSATSNAGAEYYIEGNLVKARSELEYSKSISPVYSRGLNNLGLVYFKLGNYDKALSLYKEALSVPFPYPGTYENMAMLYLTEGEKDLARHWLRIAYPNQAQEVSNYINNYEPADK